MNWTLADIKSKVRKLTGRPNTSQLSDADLLDYINQIYVNDLPLEVQTKEVMAWFELSVTEALGGNYSMSDSIFNILPGNTTAIDSDDAVSSMSLSTDYGQFFEDYPDDYDTTGTPLEMLLFNRTLYIRPLPDASYTIKFPYIKAISEFENDSDAPLDKIWGPVIAYGAAIDILFDSGEDERAMSLRGKYKYYLASIARKQLLQDPVGKRAAPRF